MKLMYISDNKMYLYDEGKVKELPSQRAAKYASTVREINRSKEWKQTGRGAMFMGTYQPSEENAEIPAMIGGAVQVGEDIVYSVNLGGMGGLYRKSIENPDADEEHVLTRMDTTLDEVALKGEKIAVIMNGHLAVADLKGDYNELIDGDTREENPFWSVSDNRIFCSTAGFARGQYGNIAAVSPRSIMAVDVENNSIDELYSDEKTDFLKPSNDAYGNFYYIKQPYRNVQEENTPLWKDILLFPVRIIKAIGGFLNAFSVIFGGESLRTNKQRGDVKTKQKSDRELYFEGRILEAEKNERENAAKGEKNAGILPVSRVLVKTDSDGSETTIKRGILDYIVLDDGSIICSNGKSILHIKDGEETVLTKAKLAHGLCILN